MIHALSYCLKGASLASCPACQQYNLSTASSSPSSTNRVDQPPPSNKATLDCVADRLFRIVTGSRQGGLPTGSQQLPAYLRGTLHDVGPIAGLVMAAANPFDASGVAALVPSSAGPVHVLRATKARGAAFCGQKAGWKTALCAQLEVSSRLAFDNGP